MSKKENNNQGMPGLGELSTIRDILMGQQMSDYDNRFSSMNEQVDALKADIMNRIQDLEERTNQHAAAMEKEMNARFDRLEKLLSDNVDKMENKIAKASKEDKNRIGRMLAKASKQFLDE